ncbi:MAG TPA: metallophosphoesterase [Polyangiaceae bacterium]|nr:metallophosphoesterase [Polyangiaceae bacterium]
MRLALSLVPPAVLLTMQGAAFAAAPRIVKGPYVTAVSDTTADVRLELDSPAAVTLQVVRERAPATLRKVVDGASSTMHVVHLTGLDAGKPYIAGINIGPTQGPVVAEVAFKTSVPADPNAGTHFIVYGDDRSDQETHAGVVRLMGQIPSDFLVNTGDIVADGASSSDWQSFFDVEAPLLHEHPLFLCIGNHELYDDEAGANFARYFGFAGPGGAPRPYGTERMGDVRFFFLNGMHDWSSGEERDWLEHELTRADGEPGLVWRIVVVHHGPWSSGPHGPNRRLIEAHIPDLLSAHKVDLVLSGHDHIYERGDAGGLKYLISGGGGAPVYKLGTPTPTTRKAESTYHFIEVTTTANDLRIVTHRAEGSILEKCGFAKGKAWDCDTAPPAPRPAAAATQSPGDAPAPAKSTSRCSVAAAGASGPRGLAALVFPGILAAILGAALARRRRG